MRRFLIILWVCLPASAYAAPQSGQFGVGVQLGEPTGLTGKLFMTDRQALDAALSYSLVDSRIHVHGNYLLHFPHQGETLTIGRWSPYTGLGARIRLKGDDKKNDQDNNLAIRLPLGVSLFLTASPLEVFLEFAPTMGLFLKPKWGSMAVWASATYFRSMPTSCAAFTFRDGEFANTHTQTCRD